MILFAYTVVVSIIWYSDGRPGWTTCWEKNELFWGDCCIYV